MLVHNGNCAARCYDPSLDGDSGSKLHGDIMGLLQLADLPNDVNHRLMLLVEEGERRHADRLTGSVAACRHRPI